MGPPGAVIMSFFGAVFAVMGLRLTHGWTDPLLLLPVVVFVALIVLAIGSMRISPPPARSPRSGRIILWSSIGEGVGIFILCNLLVNLGRADLLLPGIALIVGLHFLPMAYGIPFARFYAIGVALLIAAAAGCALPQPLGSQVAGFAAALALWSAAVVALRPAGGRSSSRS